MAVRLQLKGEKFIYVRHAKISLDQAPLSTQFTHVKSTKKQNNSLIPHMGYVTLSSKTTIVKHMHLDNYVAVISLGGDHLEHYKNDRFTGAPRLRYMVNKQKLLKSKTKKQGYFHSLFTGGNILFENVTLACASKLKYPQIFPIGPLHIIKNVYHMTYPSISSVWRSSAL